LYYFVKRRRSNSDVISCASTRDALNRPGAAGLPAKLAPDFPAFRLNPA